MEITKLIDTKNLKLYARLNDLDFPVIPKHVYSEFGKIRITVQTLDGKMKTLDESKLYIKQNEELINLKDYIKND